MEEIKTELGLSPSSDAILIRREVFMDEQGFEDEFDEIDKIAIHTVYYLDGIPVAVGRIYRDNDDNNACWLGRIAVRKPYRMRHIGSKIIGVLEKEAIRMKRSKLMLFAQLHAKGFYEKSGFMCTDEIIYEEGQPHIRMIKQL